MGAIPKNDYFKQLLKDLLIKDLFNEGPFCERVLYTMQDYCLQCQKSAIEGKPAQYSGYTVCD